MRKQNIFISGLLSAIIVAFTVWNTGYAGTTFQLLEPAQPTKSDGKIEVLEVFWYGCPHCYSLEPYLEKWLANKPEDVEFRRIPGVLANNWVPLARAYFTAEKLGIVEKIHRPMFDAIHRDGEHMNDMRNLQNFFAAYGVDKDKFTSIFESQEITEKVKDAFITGQNYKLTGVPAIIVNGKYKTSASLAGGNQKLIDVINQLIEVEKGNSD